MQSFAAAVVLEFAEFGEHFEYFKGSNVRGEMSSFGIVLLEFGEAT